MDINNVLVMLTFIMSTIMMVNQYIDTNIPKVSDALELMNILPCHEIKAFRGGKRLKTIELMEYINKPVKDFMLKEGILYIEIY